MTFSLIVATYGRAIVLGDLLESLALQEHATYEILIVDQNDDDRLAPVLLAHPSLLIQRLRSPKGLSRARNVGLAAATGDVIAFPDDDCRYPRDMLRRVAEVLERTGADGVSTMARDENGAPCGGARWDAYPGPITRSNIWRRAISIGVFLRADAARAAGGFDEALGAGAGTPFGAGEETDFLLRVLEGGRTIHFEPSIWALHPSLRSGQTEEDVARAYNYGMGLGYVLRRHRYPVAVAAAGWIRSAGGMALSAIRMRPLKARFYRAALLGKVAGWRAGGQT